MIRLNITLPDEIAQKLSQKNNKSRFIAQVLAEKFKQEQQQKIKNLMAEGYKVTSNQDREINSDWEKADLETWE